MSRSAVRVQDSLRAIPTLFIDGTKRRGKTGLRVTHRQHDWKSQENLTRELSGAMLGALDAVKKRWSACRRVAAMGRYLPWSIHFPALAAVLVLLGPTGYDRLARLRDAVLRYGRDERARRA
jgi:hypothetical protein